MASSGSGTMTGISPAAPGVVTGDYPNLPETFLSINEYWEFLQINECAGYGIRNYPTTGPTGLGCSELWNQRERYYLLSSISKAETRFMGDRWLGFPVRRFYDKPRRLSLPINSLQLYLGKYTRQIGVETETTLDTSLLLTLRDGSDINDPVSFTINVNFTDIDELVIYYPGAIGKFTIRPSSVVISSGVATVEIPRCRLLKPEFFVDYADPTDRPDYEDDDNFLNIIDVVRNYVDTTTGTNIVWTRKLSDVCNWNCLGILGTTANQVPIGSEISQLAAPIIHNQREGIIFLEPATLNDSDEYQTTNFAVRRTPDYADINFMRGYYDRYEEIDENLIRAIVAVAHNNMPQDYCGCSVQHKYWEDDNRPLEPPVRLGLGRSTWGIYEATEIVTEFDADRISHHGGML